MDTKQSPIYIRTRRVKGAGDRIEIESRATGDVLAYCFIGDDESLERIADILSSKRLPNEAMRLRQMAMDARRPLGLRGETGRGRVGYL